MIHLLLSFMHDVQVYIYQLKTYFLEHLFRGGSLNDQIGNGIRVSLQL